MRLLCGFLATNKDCRGESVNSGYFAIVTHSAPRVGQFLAYVTKSQKTNGIENYFDISNKYVYTNLDTMVRWLGI